MQKFPRRLSAFRDSWRNTRGCVVCSSVHDVEPDDDADDKNTGQAGAHPISSSESASTVSKQQQTAAAHHPISSSNNDSRFCSRYCCPRRTDARITQIPLGSSRVESIRLDTFDVSSESRRAWRSWRVEPCLFQRGGRRRSTSACVYTFSFFVLCAYT